MGAGREPAGPAFLPLPARAGPPARPPNFLASLAYKVTIAHLRRFAKAGKSNREEWLRFTKDYFITRDNLVSVMLLVDSSLPPQASGPGWRVGRGRVGGRGWERRALRHGWGRWSPGGCGCGGGGTDGMSRCEGRRPGRGIASHCCDTRLMNSTDELPNVQDTCIRGTRPSSRALC